MLGVKVRERAGRLTRSEGKEGWGEEGRGPGGIWPLRVEVGGCAHPPQVHGKDGLQGKLAPGCPAAPQVSEGCGARIRCPSMEPVTQAEYAEADPWAGEPGFELSFFPGQSF